MIELGAVAACVLGVLILLIAERQGLEYLRWIAKTAASAAFVAFAYAGVGLGGSLDLIAMSPKKYLFFGLVACMAGDILLLPKARLSFLLGMAAFGVGHILYIFAFGHLGASLPLAALLSIVIIIFVERVVLREIIPNLGAMAAPVRAYALVTSIMVATILSTIASGDIRWGLVFGAVSFAISDVAVARDQFVKDQFANKLWGLPLYYGAQLLIAGSVSGI